MTKWTRFAMLGVAVLGAFSLTAHAANVTLRASHQFPGGKGDVRDEMVQMIAREAKAANVGLEVQVYPGASLFKPNEQWNALVNGQLDISSFPLDYASGKVRAFGATLMPGLVRSHERAARLNDSQFMKDIRAQVEKNGVIVLSDAWLAGAMASKKACIRKPDDVKGLKFRSAGPTFAAMWQAAGASIVSVPSNEPVLMSKKSFQRLDKKQQDVLLAAGRKAQDYFRKEAPGLDSEMVKAFKEHKVEVITLTPAEYEAWVNVAKKSSYEEFAKEVPEGKKLIDEALGVQ
jgi:TRAP-type C4-dicarboxylate transport system substrate-binding protein